MSLQKHRIQIMVCYVALIRHELHVEEEFNTKVGPCEYTVESEAVKSKACLIISKEALHKGV